MNNMKLVGTVEGKHIDVKRFYLPGVSIEGVCPKCQTPWKHPFGENHLSYPTVGAVERVYGYCQECDHEWSMGVVLSMSLSLVDETPK